MRICNRARLLIAVVLPPCIASIYSFLASQSYIYNDFYYGLVNKTDDKGIIFSEKNTISNFRKSTERENKMKYDRYNPITLLSAITFEKIMKIYLRSK